MVIVRASGVTPTTTFKKEDIFSAQFNRNGGADLGKLLRNELPPGFPNLNPTPGSCVVYDVSTLKNPFPNYTSIGLDAGPQLTSNGPNGTQLALRLNNQVSGPTYNAANVPNTYLSPGRYALSGPGGADVGAFTGSLDIVQDLVVTNNPDDFKAMLCFHHFMLFRHNLDRSGFALAATPAAVNFPGQVVPHLQRSAFAGPRR